MIIKCISLHWTEDPVPPTLCISILLKNLHSMCIPETKDKGRMGDRPQAFPVINRNQRFAIFSAVHGTEDKCIHQSNLLDLGLI